MDDTQPTVSVIIPTYNREKFIGDAIKSVLDQTFQDFEIIVVDDGSTDGTAGVIKEFYSEKIRYIYQSNQGRSQARNHALNLAQGRYIAFLDSDDLYLPEKLGMQVDFMDKHPDYGMIYTSAYCVDENGNSLPHVYEAKASGWIYEDIAFFVPVTITLPTVMARREAFEAVGGFDENMERFEDTDMWRRISKKFRIGAMQTYTCLLRTHHENSLITQNPGKILAAIEYYVAKINREDVDVGWLVRRRGIAKLYVYYGGAMMSVPEWRNQGYLLLAKAVRSWPLVVMTAAYWGIRKIISRARVRVEALN
ncbi:MAG: glycosyltransferase family 2 protein [Thiobacillus sp.]|nr:glycosyltransferase family 2 protein [Thiobacillus sp.]